MSAAPITQVRNPQGPNGWSRQAWGVDYSQASALRPTNKAEQSTKRHLAQQQAGELPAAWRAAAFVRACMHAHKCALQACGTTSAGSAAS